MLTKYRRKARTCAVVKTPLKNIVKTQIPKKSNYRKKSIPPLELFSNMVRQSSSPKTWSNP